MRMDVGHLICWHPLTADQMSNESIMSDSVTLLCCTGSFPLHHLASQHVFIVLTWIFKTFALVYFVWEYKTRSLLLLRRIVMKHIVELCRVPTLVIVIVVFTPIARPPSHLLTRHFPAASWGSWITPPTHFTPALRVDSIKKGVSITAYKYI